MAKKKLTSAQQTAQGLGVVLAVIAIAAVIGLLMQFANYKLENGKNGLEWVPRIGVSSVTGIQIDDSKANTLTFRVKLPASVDGVQFRVSRWKNVMWIGQNYQTASGIKQVGGLKGGKTYYVQVRSYKDGGLGRKVFGSWSAISSRRVREKRK